MKLQRSATESQNQEVKHGDDSDRCSVSQSKLFVNWLDEKEEDEVKRTAARMFFTCLLESCFREDDTVTNTEQRVCLYSDRDYINVSLGPQINWLF